MKKNILGAALFFIGVGIFLTLLVPMNYYLSRLIVAIVLMAVGYKLETGCRG